MGCVGDCVVVEVDGKAFEAHVSVAQLKLEQGVYRAAYPGDRALMDMLGAQLSLRGRTAGGVKYFREGCRASGDYNTGLGNTLLMGTFVICAMDSLDLARPWSVLADGDNCLLFMRVDDLELVVDKFPLALSSLCGHEMTVEKPSRSLEEVVFGQSHPVRTGRGLVMARDPYKVLSGAFCGYRHFHDRKFTPRLVRGIAMAEQAVSRGLPVVGPYFDEVVRLTTKYKSIRSLEFFLEGHLIGALPDPGYVPVTPEARESYSRAFGLGVEEQLLMEKRLIAGLRRDLVQVLDSGCWLENVVEVLNGKTLDSSTNSHEWLFTGRYFVP
jgi:hypothetical protein